MITFNSVDDLLELINNLDGCGLLVGDNDELRQHLADLRDTEITGNSAAFVLKYKDLLAPGTISDWITRAEMESVPTEKVASANQQLRIVRDFQTRHPEQCQMPD